MTITTELFMTSSPHLLTEADNVVRGLGIVALEDARVLFVQLLGRKIQLVSRLHGRLHQCDNS